MYEIEQTVPPPDPRTLPNRRGAPPVKYPWSALKVGESFFVPYGDDDRAVVMRRTRNALSDARKRRATSKLPAGAQFVWAQTKHKGKHGLRVWRTK